MSEDKDYFGGRYVEMTDLNREDRERMRPIVGATVAAILLGAVALYAVLYSPKAKAEEIPVHVYDRGGVLVRMMGTPCADVMSAMLLAQGLPKYADRAKAIQSTWPMQDGSRRDFAGCWLELSAEEVGGGADALVLVFEDGQNFIVRKDEFLQKRGQSGA